MTTTDDTRQIGIVLFPDVEELDAVGPYEVLAYWTRTFPEDGYSTLCISRDGGMVTCAKGLVIQAHTSFAQAPALDVLLHPGGVGTRPMLKDERHLDWVREQRATVPLMTSVCSGALVFAAAGLLRHRPATTHWGAFGLLASLAKDVTVDREARFVDDGVMTSAGVASGMDLALHIVETLFGRAVADETARYIEYRRG
jgi:transcriptional regulator GlxA family with amidase domain